MDVGMRMCLKSVERNCQCATSVQQPALTVSDKCSECNVEVKDFCVHFHGKTRKYFDLCVRHNLK